MFSNIFYSSRFGEQIGSQAQTHTKHRQTDRRAQIGSQAHTYKAKTDRQTSTDRKPSTDIQNADRQTGKHR